MAKHLLLGSTVALALMLALVGCNSPESTTPSTSAESRSGGPDAGQEEHDGHGEHAHDGHDQAAEESSGDARSDMEKMTEALADLSADDRDSAMKQHFCPVSDQMLGSMGTPEKVDVNGQSVWICCDGCKDKLLAEPDKYLAKLTEGE